MKALFKQTSLTTIFTWIVFCVAVIFADLMYLQLVFRVVAPGWQILAIGGAFALGTAVIILPRKLVNGDIQPGVQRTVAIGVLLFDFLLMVANVVVAFAESRGDISNEMLGLYATYVSPATPVLVAGGILAIWLADPLDQAKRESDEAAMMEAVLTTRIKTKLKLATLAGIERSLESPEHQAAIDAEVNRRTIATIREAFGGNAFATTGNGPTHDGNAFATTGKPSLTGATTLATTGNDRGNTTTLAAAPATPTAPKARLAQSPFGSWDVLEDLIPVVGEQRHPNA